MNQSHEIGEVEGRLSLFFSQLESGAVSRETGDWLVDFVSEENGLSCLMN